MLRAVLAVIVLGGVALGGPDQALAIDYEEPVVPAEFLLVPPQAPPSSSGAPLRLLVRAADGSPLPWQGLENAQTPQIPGEDNLGAAPRRANPFGEMRVVPGNQWVESRVGCLLAYWATC